MVVVDPLFELRPEVFDGVQIGAIHRVFKLRVVATVEGVQKASRLICSFVRPVLR
jgi:hypothetical protein